MTKKILQSSLLTDEEKFWLDEGKKYVGKAIETIESAGKQLMTMLTTVNGIYLAAVTFSDIMKGNLTLGYRILFIAPLLFWLASIFFAMRLFKTQTHEVVLISPDDIKTFYQRTVFHKQRQLNASFTFLVTGLFVVIAAILVRYAR